MATVTLPTQGQTPWDGTLNAAITTINDQVDDHEERIDVLEAGGGGGGSTAWDDITGKPSTFPPTIGSTGTTAVAGNDARLTDQRTPSDNSVTSAKIVNGTIVDADINASAAIAQSKVSGLTTALSGKESTLTAGTNITIDRTNPAAPVISASGGGGGGSTAWADITGKPSTFPPVIGSGAGDAVAGNDSRLTDQRTPSDNSVTSAKIVDGTIVNADINASAAIAQSKVANLSTDLAAKAPLASPAFTGTPTAPTATAGTNTTQLATTAFVQGLLGSRVINEGDTPPSNGIWIVRPA